MANYYRQTLGPDDRPASLAGGYWEDNLTENNVESGATTYAGQPIVLAHFFGPDYATGDRTPTQTPIVIT